MAYSPLFIEMVAHLLRSMCATFCPCYLLVLDNSLTYFLLLQQVIYHLLLLFAIFICLELSIPTFETIQPAISFRVLPLPFNYNSGERRILLTVAIAVEPGLAMY